MSTETQSPVSFSWHWNLKIVLTACCLLPVLLGLGFWQLERAEEKQIILNRFDTNQRAAPAALEVLDSDQDQQYRPAWLRGELDGERTLFLDNRVRHGVPGYEVLQLLNVRGDKRAVLVNRGWIVAPMDRNQLPSLEILTGELQLRGSLYRNLSDGFQLNDGIGQVDEWPARVGWISVERAEQLFKQPLYPYQLRLDRDSRGALETGWMTVNVQPEKHIGYAVQWFSMAVVLIVMTLFANSNLAQLIKRKK